MTMNGYLSTTRTCLVVIALQRAWKERFQFKATELYRLRRRNVKWVHVVSCKLKISLHKRALYMSKPTMVLGETKSRRPIKTTSRHCSVHNCTVSYLRAEIQRGLCCLRHLIMYYAKTCLEYRQPTEDTGRGCMDRLHQASTSKRY